MRWRPLNRFSDRAVPKLHNLRRAAAAGLRVPPTWWLCAAEAASGPVPPPPLGAGPLLVRSGSPTEDTRLTSNAGQLLSLRVEPGGDLQEAVRRVAAALPRDERGGPRGAVFVQPWIAGVEAGVAFCDGFYFERSTAAGSNEAVTGGRSRGAVERGHLRRADPWSEWLSRVHGVFGGGRSGRVNPDDAGERGVRGETGERGVDLEGGGSGVGSAIDVELARDESGYILLQVRPALFAVARNETLSLANHREILGDPPSPWIASALIEAGRDALAYFAAVDPEIASWRESYAVELAGRAWLNVSFFFRLMDRWGLPRSWVTEGVGGEGGGPADRRILWPRFLVAIPRLVRLQRRNLRTLSRMDDGLADLDRQLAAAESPADLHRATAAGIALALRTNFALGGALTGVARLRRRLGIRTAGSVVTREMMEEYARIGQSPLDQRAPLLARWLDRFGHRGPLESDPARPRFAELAGLLERDLLAVQAPPEPLPPEPRLTPLLRPLFRLEERRERFRDELMRRWVHLRRAIRRRAEVLVAEGKLDAVDDVFFLPGNSLTAGDLRPAANSGRAAAAQAATLDLPSTASRQEIEEAMRAHETTTTTPSSSVFPGIPLSPAVVEGRAVKARDLVALLAAPELLGPEAILVVEALEPSWAVVFPRVLGVVAEIGGELSHASILLREARRPAIVNCAGIYRAIATGDRLRLDGRHGLVERMERVDQVPSTSPPSTEITAPCTKLASSEASQR